MWVRRRDANAAVQLRPGNAAPEREGKGVGEDEEGVGKLITSSIRVEVDRSGIEAGGRRCLSYAAVEGVSRRRGHVRRSRWRVEEMPRRPEQRARASSRPAAE